MLSFLALGAKCRGCRNPISWRYPAVEALTGSLFLAAAWLLVVRTPGGWREAERVAHLLVAWILLADLVALSFIDLDHRILPDRLTKPGMAVGAVASLLLPRLQDTSLLPTLAPSAAALLLSLAGMAAGYASLWLVAWAGERLLRKEAMGLGDAKLLALVGAFTGPGGVLIAAVVGLLLGLLMGLARQAVTKDPSFPFGPALAVGGVGALLAPAEVRAGLGAAADLSADPRGGLAVAVICGLLLLSIRGRLPRGAFLLLALLAASLAGLNLALLLK